MSIPVIVLNWNGLTDTMECVDALLGMDHRDFLVVLVDNGSDGDDFSQLRARFGDEPRVQLRRNDENLGFTRGMNHELERLIADGGYPYIALLNNDAVPAADWLSSLEAAARREQTGAVASLMLRYDDSEHVDNAGHIMLNTGEILPRGTGQPATDYQAPAELIGGCAGAILLSTKMLGDIGIFDAYFRTGYEDAELGLRAFMAGYPTNYCPDAVVRHKVSRSVDKIRDYEFAVKLQQDINYSYLKLMPWPVILLNSPFLLIKHLGIFLTALLMFRWRLLRVQTVALRRTLAELPRIRAARREAAPLCRISWWKVVQKQRFFLSTYVRYFQRYMIRRKKTVFER